ncbi:MAG: hypothetical protein ACP5GS_01275 [Nitrososphaeria archaeon]
MATAGQLDAGGVPEPTPQAIPAVAEKQVIEEKPSNKRTNKARLLPKGGSESSGGSGYQRCTSAIHMKLLRRNGTGSQKICGHIMN